jgi:TRAP-type mannitol/chloroaromatic compound transport system permease large subunit
VHIRIPTALLLLLYAAALGVAVADLGSRALAGAVVLAGLLVRWRVRAHSPARAAPAAVPVPVPPGPAATG